MSASFTFMILPVIAGADIAVETPDARSRTPSAPTALSPSPKTAISLPPTV